VAEGHCGGQVRLRDIASIEEKSKKTKKKKKSISEVIPNLTLFLLTWIIWCVPNNANKWQMGYNSAFKGLTKISFIILLYSKRQLSEFKCVI